MAKEIERKFLLQDTQWLASYKGFEILQGYIFIEPQKALRVRIAESQAYIALKAEHTGITRLEFEYEIPANDAREILYTVCIGNPIEKTRYRVRFEDHDWEIDRFHGVNSGLCLAEIELTDESEQFRLPPWLGKEVTHDARYTNANLALHPFSSW